MRYAQFKRLPVLDYQGREAINTICSNLSFAGHSIKKVVLTSCNQNDGKSFLAMQIAQNLAARGKTVVLVDCDLRKSHIVSHYGMTTTGDIVGTVHYLAGYNTLDDVLFSTDVPNFYIIPAGRDIASPIPLLDSPEFAHLLDQLASMFDLVLVDAPPVGMVIDAAVIARNCDGTVLVLKYMGTHRRELTDAKRQMEQAGCRVLGCVLNEVTFDTISAKKYYNRSYYSHYGRYYQHHDQSSSKKRPNKAKNEGKTNKP